MMQKSVFQYPQPKRLQSVSVDEPLGWRVHGFGTPIDIATGQMFGIVWTPSDCKIAIIENDTIVKVLD